MAKQADIGFGTFSAVIGFCLLIGTAAVALSDFGATHQVLAGSLAVAGALCFVATSICYHADRQPGPAGPGAHKEAGPKSAAQPTAPAGAGPAQPDR
jgi:hypothetical protein